MKKSFYYAVNGTTVSVFRIDGDVPMKVATVNAESESDVEQAVINELERIGKKEPIIHRLN